MFDQKITLPSHRYQRIERADSPEPEKDGACEDTPSRRTVSCGGSQIPLSVALIVLVVCTALAFLLGIAIPSRANASRWCTQKISQPSPVTNDIDIEYNVHQFNGSLLKENVYRQASGPQVDAAWAALGVNYRAAVVPEDIAQSVGLASDQVKISDEFGGGYPANVEGLHHLHCLNLLRQTLYFNFDYYNDKGEGAFKNEPHILRKHVTHCLDILRQQLMCTVDVGVLGQVWVQTGSSEYPRAFVDFNTKHTCRNFEAIRQWAEERQVPEEPPKDFLEPPKEGDRIYHEIP